MYLSEGTNSEEESQSAMAMAQRIMDKHDLSIVDIQKTESDYVDKDFLDTLRQPMETCWVQKILQDFFHVSFYYRSKLQIFKETLRKKGKRNYVFGKPHHVEIAVNLYPRLIAIYKGLWHQHREKYGGNCLPSKRFA